MNCSRSLSYLEMLTLNHKKTSTCRCHDNCSQKLNTRHSVRRNEEESSCCHILTVCNKHKI